jgi:hypothetical protein
MKTKAKEIIAYWETKVDESDLGVDWAEAHERCWRCGYKSPLERCHIVPRSLGGSDHPSNLVLLCQRCHREAPNIDDSEFMWIWIKGTKEPFYDTYWTQRGLEEFENMFKRNAFSELDHDVHDIKDIKKVFKNELKKTIVHFAEGHLNPATIACIIAKVERRFKEQAQSKKNL